MITHYTPTGLPVLLEWEESFRVELNDLYTCFTSNERTFEETMKCIKDILSVRDRYGDVFTLLLDDSVKVSQSVYSFIMKYAYGIMGRPLVEMTSDTILLMLTPSELDPAITIEKSDEDTEVLQSIARMDKVSFIRTVENTIGLVKLVEFYKLYLTPSKMDLERS